MTPSSSDLGLLRNGPAVPVALLRRILAAEARGVRFELAGDTVAVRPRRLLTQDDILAFTAQRELVRELVAYVDGLVVQ